LVPELVGARTSKNIYVLKNILEECGVNRNTNETWSGEKRDKYEYSSDAPANV